MYIPSETLQVKACKTLRLYLLCISGKCMHISYNIIHMPLTLSDPLWYTIVYWWSCPNLPSFSRMERNEAYTMACCGSGEFCRTRIDKVQGRYRRHRSDCSCKGTSSNMAGRPFALQFWSGCSAASCLGNLGPYVALIYVYIRIHTLTGQLCNHCSRWISRASTKSASNAKRIVKRKHKQDWSFDIHRGPYSLA